MFDADGAVLAVRALALAAGAIGLHVPPGVFRSIVALESGTVFIEIKAGPYAVPVAAEWGAVGPGGGRAGGCRLPGGHGRGGQRGLIGVAGRLPASSSPVTAFAGRGGLNR